MPEPYDVDQAASLLRCSPYTVRELCKSGRIPGIKFGEDWIIPSGALFSRLDELALEEATARRNSVKPNAVLKGYSITPVNQKNRSRPVLPNLTKEPAHASAN